MAIGADDLTLRHLLEYRLPWPLADPGADRELLVPQMVELQDDGICLSAVDARVLSKKGDEIGQTLGDDLLPTTPGRVDVALAVPAVVLVLVSGSARAAVVIALPTGLSTPSEFLERFRLSASPTRPHVRRVGIRTDVPLGRSG
ncbi:MAG TPA: hypothetical protein VFM94_11220 [Solirubrobacterales bacterium]|nr:hypothetical protein [Solirubrobacterales bacterium]